MSESGAAREMPKYVCHKTVWALKICGITTELDGTATLHPSDGAFGPIHVPAEYVVKHSPRVGGYYVQYEDGYKSFSPAKAFEEGYTRV